MASARQRLEELDSQLRALESRFIGAGVSQGQAAPVLPPLPDIPSTRGPATSDAGAWQDVPPAVPAAPPSFMGVSAGGLPPRPPAPQPPHPPAAAAHASSRTDAPAAPPRPPLATAAQPAARAAAQGPTKFVEVPLRLYREGLPHRDLGPPKSVWEADKNAAVVALADRVQQLESELETQTAIAQQAQHGPEPGPGPGPAGLMPPPSVDLLPVPRNVLGGTAHKHVASYDGIHAGGPEAGPVKYYPPPPPEVGLSPEQVLARVPAAQGPKGQARAFAASVTNAAATVPSVMARRRRNAENAQPPDGGDDGNGDDDDHTPGGAGPGPGGVSSVGVSAPVGHASVKASAAASVHMAALREAAPLQPAGPYPMVAAALAQGTPGTGGSTWEQSKMRALMSLEQQRDILRAQLEAYKDIEDRHRRQMVQLNEQHRKQLLEAAGLAGDKLKRLMGSAGHVFARRLLVLRLSRALQAWRRIALRNRRLLWATSVWRRKELEVVFVEWQSLAFAHRQARQARRRATARYQRTLLLAWAGAAGARRTKRQLEQRGAQARLRRLWAAWRQRVPQLLSKRLRLRAAEEVRKGRLLRCGWRGLAGEVERSREAEAALRSRIDRAWIRAAFKTWLANTRLGRKLDAMHRRAVLRCVLRAWLARATRVSVLRRKAGALAAVWRRRRRGLLLAAWAAAARRQAKLAAAERALSQALRLDLLAFALHCLRIAPRERRWARRRGAVWLRAWRAVAARAARNRRLVAARRAAKNFASLAAMFDAWRVLAKARSVQLHLREIHRLQELEPMYEHQMELVRQDRSAVQNHLRALMAECNLLRAEVVRGLVMGAEGGLLGRPLRWRSLPPDPGQWQPQPRSRHSALCLRALQLPPAPPPSVAGAPPLSPLPLHTTMRSSMASLASGAGEALGGTYGGYHLGTIDPLTGTATRTRHVHHGGEVAPVVPGVAGVLVVFGGVGDELWFRDLHVLEVVYTEGGSTSFHWHGVEIDLLEEDAPSDPAGLAEASGRPPGPTPADPPSPGAPGGLDPDPDSNPSLEPSYTRRGRTQTRGRSTSAGPPPPKRHLSPDALANKLPLPTRRDHAACVTSPNQFVIVGGYDGNTELMDVQAITVRAGEDSVGWLASVRRVRSRNREPPGRCHHTATCHPEGRSLYVFGGYASGHGILGELWAFHLDHHEWWEPETTGDQPPRRRNHVAALVRGRLYVHGGFDGTHCLGDTWVLDPQTWHWSRLQHRGGTPPSPRRGHAAEVVADRYLVVQGGYDGAGCLSDGAVLDTETGDWWDLAAAGGPEDMPTARAHHSLTLVGHVLVAVGGAGPLGPLLDLHLLESPPLVAGLAQAYRLMQTAAQLSAVQAGMADLDAALAVTRNRAELAEQQLHLLRDRSGELIDKWNLALTDIERLKQRVATEAVRVVAAEAATAQAQLALATAERRLRRTREGGKEIADAARDMHDTVYDLREEVARLRSQLLTAAQRHSREASLLASTQAERQLLQQQLAGVQQEAALLRGMMATAEAEFRAALDRTRGAAEAEAAAAAEHAKDLARAAAGVAGGSWGASDMDLVALQQLAAATARAETADIRLHALEREHGALQAEVGTLKRSLAQQRVAREAADERASAAMAHMHSSELKYQAQIEDLQRQLAEAHRERWRHDLSLGPSSRKRAAAEPALPEEPVKRHDVATETVDMDSKDPREEAERLLREARPPEEGLVEEPNRIRAVAAGAGAVLDPLDPNPQFTIQHVEELLLEDPALGVLPEVARLLQLQRRLMGRGV
ncbi:hypothetical protein HYH03_014426 [Edaphochlamys debaryana]|uniref:Uncharacterized protein n=1 Tax=Edaphochlamys debaryana TaxID=47281 RepID=A0A836BSA2_9CHLO|nr:hypothetical protein HYH03_014426 [Edaphochlamys debaryana]|eukprot:KAG2486927.1 hypothetical protein HYH03_014426 [Edaphochlamys debaryana]